MFDFPLALHAEPDGSAFNVTFRDLPEALTFGLSVADALVMAADCLTEALAGRIVHGEEIPFPSAPQKDEYLVGPPAWLAAKAALHVAMLQRGVSKSELARRMNVDEKEVRRLLDPRIGSKLPRLEAALQALGKVLVLSVRDQEAARF